MSLAIAEFALVVVAMCLRSQPVQQWAPPHQLHTASFGTLVLHQLQATQMQGEARISTTYHSLHRYTKNAFGTRTYNTKTYWAH